MILFYLIMNNPESKPINIPPQHCYRHPEAKSGGFCIGCGKPICPTCIVLYRNLFYCPTCYAVVEVTNTAIAEQEAKKSKWYYSVPFVLLMLFVVVGPFAFPLLWKSPRFNRTSKIILTIGVSILTIFLLWLTYMIIHAYWNQYRDIMKMVFQ
ncbi:MAG: hypothetical protein ACE14V_05930 [bacterium]